MNPGAGVATGVIRNRADQGNSRKFAALLSIVGGIFQPPSARSGQDSHTTGSLGSGAPQCVPDLAI